jgi:hypothetical protein
MSPDFVVGMATGILLSAGGGCLALIFTAKRDAPTPAEELADTQNAQWRAARQAAGLSSELAMPDDIRISMGRRFRNAVVVTARWAGRAVRWTWTLTARLARRLAAQLRRQPVVIPPWSEHTDLGPETNEPETAPEGEQQPTVPELEPVMVVIPPWTDRQGERRAHVPAHAAAEVAAPVAERRVLDFTLEVPPVFAGLKNAMEIPTGLLLIVPPKVEPAGVLAELAAEVRDAVTVGA